MGTGASKDPLVGVAANPRVQYTDERAKKEGKSMLIDAPVLVDLNHGTVRYRYVADDKEQKHKLPRTEQPHEGPERKRKHGYFYHARLNDFSEEAEYKKEDDFKFRYVFQGPNSAMKKKLYYVYGTGTKAKDSRYEQKSKDARPKGRGYVWPQSYRQANHVYYEMTFVTQDGELSDEDEEEDIAVEAESHRKNIQLKVKRDDTISTVKTRLGLRLLKPTDSIHISVEDSEARNEEVMDDFQEEKNKWERYRIQLRKV